MRGFIDFVQNVQKYLENISNVSSDIKKQIAEYNKDTMKHRKSSQNAEYASGDLFIELLGSRSVVSTFLNDINNAPETSSYFSLDLRSSEWAKVQSFFDLDNNKYKFSIKYVELISSDNVTPEWIQEIIDLLK